MKVVILAGGQQSTLANMGEGIPKPMAEIGGKPLLWHIMKHFSKYGIGEFIICGGYRVDVIKEYFLDYYIYESDITVDLADNTIQIHQKRTENWKVTVVDTGLDSTPGQRINMIAPYVKEDDSFIVTYGDCLSSIDAEQLHVEHTKKGKLMTMVLAKPLGRKQLMAIDEEGLLDIDNISPYVEKMAWVNAYCFVLDRKVLDYLTLENDLEKGVIPNLAKLGQVATYCHEGYWATIETLRDLLGAERLWREKSAPWLN